MPLPKNQSYFDATATPPCMISLARFTSCGSMSDHDELIGLQGGFVLHDAVFWDSDTVQPDSIAVMPPVIAAPSNPATM